MKTLVPVRSGKSQMIEHVLGPLAFFAWFWVIFLVFSGLASAPMAYWGRRRARWRLWELSAFVVPYWTWAACNLVDSSGKSLSNVAVELMWLTVAVPAGVIMRIVAGPCKWRVPISTVLIGALCCLAISLWAFVPPLPE